MKRPPQFIAVAPKGGQRLRANDTIESEFEASVGEPSIGDEEPLAFLVLGGVVSVVQENQLRADEVPWSKGEKERRLDDGVAVDFEKVVVEELSDVVGGEGFHQLKVVHAHAERAFQLQLERTDAVDGFEIGETGGEVEERLEETVLHGEAESELRDQKHIAVVLGRGNGEIYPEQGERNAHHSSCC